MTQTSRPDTGRVASVPLELGSGGRWQRIGRHVVCAAASGLLTWFFWRMRPNWVPEMRLWKAVGDASYALLIAALAIGPLGTLFAVVRKANPWRRQLGIWFALTGLYHGFLILDGWAEWSLRRFLGYEFIPQLGREARIEPGFGLSNLVGLAALFLAVVLASTSSDWAIRKLGRPAWAWLHRMSQTILVLALLHGGYFLFIHFTPSFHKQPPPLDWFRLWFVALGGLVLVLQAVTFAKSAGGKAGTEAVKA